MGPDRTVAAEEPANQLELRNSLDAIKANLDTIQQRRALLEDVDAYLAISELIPQQRELNQKLIDNSIKLKGLRKRLEEIGSMKKLFSRKIKDPEIYDLLEKEIKKISDETIALWRGRRGTQGETIDIKGLSEKKAELRRRVEAGMNMIVRAQSFLAQVEKLRSQTREDEIRKAELEKEARSLEVQLQSFEGR